MMHKKNVILLVYRKQPNWKNYKPCAIDDFMGIGISRREVLNNLIRFKDSLLEFREEELSEKKGKKRIYKAFFNRKTGDLRFAQKINESHFSSKGKSKGSLDDWKEIHLIVREEEEHPFEIFDGEDHPLNSREIAPLAWRILSETLNVLNQKAQEAEIGSDLLMEEFILRDLSSIHLAPRSSHIEDLPGWEGSLSREGAEKKLAGKSVGNYLLREGDELTLSIAFHLEEEERSYVHPYLLTFVDREEKISEILILHTSKGWTFYCDDPDLKQPFYHYYFSVEDLLGALHSVAQTPTTEKAG